jgi:hypothetical protein
VVPRPSGTGQTVRFHIATLTTAGAFNHANGTGTSHNQADPDAAGTLEIGRIDGGGFWWSGRLALAACWIVELTDTQIDAFVTNKRTSDLWNSAAGRPVFLTELNTTTLQGFSRNSVLDVVGTPSLTGPIRPGGRSMASGLPRRLLAAPTSALAGAIPASRAGLDRVDGVPVDRVAATGARRTRPLHAIRSHCRRPVSGGAADRRVPRGGGGYGWPGGGTEVFENSSDASDDVTASAWKAADGSDDGTTITVSHGSTKASALCWSITGAAVPSIPPEPGTVAAGRGGSKQSSGSSPNTSLGRGANHTSAHANGRSPHTGHVPGVDGSERSDERW